MSRFISRIYRLLTFALIFGGLGSGFTAYWFIHYMTPYCSVVNAANKVQSVQSSVMSLLKKDY